MENIADLYYEKLSKTDNPGKVLALFFEGVFDRPFSIQDVVMFNKLKKIYGKYIPFFAVLDLFSYEKAEINDNMFGLLSFYCKKRLEQKTEIVVLNDAYKSLDSIAERVKERIEAQKPTKQERMD